MFIKRRNMSKKSVEKETNFVLVRVGRNTFIKNLIVDEKLLSFMVMRDIYPEQVDKSVVGKYLGWHKGEDGKIYDTFVWNDERFSSYLHNPYTTQKDIIESYDSFLKEHNIYLNQLRKIVNNIQDGSLEYYKFRTYFIKSGVKEICKYDKSCEKLKNIDESKEL